MHTFMHLKRGIKIRQVLRNSIKNVTRSSTDCQDPYQHVDEREDIHTKNWLVIDYRYNNSQSHHQVIKLSYNFKILVIPHTTAFASEISTQVYIFHLFCSRTAILFTLFTTFKIQCLTFLLLWLPYSSPSSAFHFAD